jgi:hypothetical protein
MAQNKNMIITAALAIIIVIAIGVYAYTTFFSGNETPTEENNDTNETLLTIQYLGNNYTYTLSDLEEFNTETGSGRFIKTKLLPDTIVLGDVYTYTGISIPMLLEDIPVSFNDYILNVTATDNWTVSYTMNQSQGIVDVYDENGNVTHNGSALMILAYKEDGSYYSEIDPDNETGPIRIAFIGENTPITSSNLWAKKVASIEIIELIKT